MNLKKILFHGALVGLGLTTLFSLKNIVLIESPSPLATKKVSYKQDEDGYSFIVKRAEGLTRRRFSRKQFTKDSAIEITSEYRFARGWKFYSDSGGGEDPNMPDGLVDEISEYDNFMSNDPTLELSREKHYKNFKPEFDKADRYVAETKEIFAKEMAEKGIN